MHRDAYNDMVRSKEHVSYEVPYEHTRVSRLLRSIQVGHIASIAAAKTTIEATPGKRDDFEEAADFLILNAPSAKAVRNEHRISVLRAGGNDSDDENPTKTLDDYANVNVDDRFYTRQEYSQLSSNQKHKLKLLRDKRGNQSNNVGKRKRRNMNKKAKFKKMKKENEEMRQRISALESNSTNGNNNSGNGNINNNNTTAQNDNGNNNNKIVRFNQRNQGNSSS